MNLTLYNHPLASFCHKVLVALYETNVPFESVIVDLGDRTASATFFEMWPIGKIPVLRDERQDRTVPETSVIIEYLQQRYPGPAPLLPDDEDDRLEVRLWDRFFDSYIHAPMQAIVAERLRPEGEKDPRGVSDAHAGLRTAYGMFDRRMADRTWAVGEAFSMADCAAAPALFYAGVVSPFAADFPNIEAYAERLCARPSFARVLDEARPYFQYFPFKDDMPARFLGDASGR